MEFYEVINKRRTIRDFKNETIDDAVIKRIIQAGMKAPSNDHMRDWHFIVIKDKDKVKKLINKIPETFSKKEVEDILKDWNLCDKCQQEAYKNAIPKQYRMLLNASCVIIPLFNQKTDVLHPDNLSHLNGFASMWCCLENMFLATTAEGYDSVLRIPLGDEGEYARKVLNFPDNYIMPCYIAIGKRSDNCTLVKQKEYNLSDRIHINRWN